MGAARPNRRLPTSPAASVVKEPEAGVSAVPVAPQGRPLLAITGRIAATNGAGTLSLDRAQLDRLGLLAVSVNDPWAKQRIGAAGRVAARPRRTWPGPTARATSLHMTALDDYQIDLSLADVRSQPIFLATRTGDGAELPVEEGGPTRVVFTDDLAPRFSPDMWIWNIETIEVR